MLFQHKKFNAKMLRREIALSKVFPAKRFSVISYCMEKECSKYETILIKSSLSASGHCSSSLVSRHVWLQKPVGMLHPRTGFKIRDAIHEQSVI